MKNNKIRTHSDVVSSNDTDQLRLSDRNRDNVSDNQTISNVNKSKTGEPLAASSLLGIIFSSQEFPCEWSYDYDLNPNSVVIPWLNLLFLSPELALSEGQSGWLYVPVIKKQVYDTLLESKFGQKLRKLEEKLQHIYPHSFLFQLSPQQIEYRNGRPYLLTIRDFVELVHQILCVDFAERPVGEIGRVQFVRKSYSQIPEQIRRNNRLEIDDVLGEFSQRGLCLEDSLWDMTQTPNDQAQRRGEKPKE